MADQVRDQIRDYILENYLFTTDTSALRLDESLLESGVVDSSGMLEIILFIEDQFGVTMDASEMIPDNLDSVNKICEFVSAKTAGASR